MNKTDQNNYKIPAFLRKKSINDINKPKKKRGRPRKTDSRYQGGISTGIPQNGPGTTFSEPNIQQPSLQQPISPTHFNQAPTFNNQQQTYNRPEPSLTNPEPSQNLRKMLFLGTIEHYFEKINVIALTIAHPLRVGDRILIENQEGIFEQMVASMQIEREDIRYAAQGRDIGLKILLPTFLGAKVYKVL